MLANKACDKTLTVTPTLWAMFGILPVAAVQLAHRHQSVALDLIIDCKPGCYTLVGQELDEQGQIVDPDRMDWKPASAFVTPPGYWHAHYNESGQPAYLLPIQDAGLQTYLRTLDIQFTSPKTAELDGRQSFGASDAKIHPPLRSSGLNSYVQSLTPSLPHAGAHASRCCQLATSRRRDVALQGGPMDRRPEGGMMRRSENPSRDEDRWRDPARLGTHRVQPG